MSELDKLINESKNLYKKLYNTEAPHTGKASNLLNRLKDCPVTDIIYKSDGVKVLLKDVFIDYDYGYENSIFITQEKPTGYKVGEFEIDDFPFCLKTFLMEE